MSIWDVYQDRITVHGGDKRNASLLREVRLLNTKLPDSLSYQSVEIYPQEYGYNIGSEESAEHCVTQNVAIINSDNLDEKLIYSLPSEDIELGSLIHWMDNYWLVTERDANTTVYTKAKLIQCNHLLKWVTDDHEIIEQWCIFADGTKYLTGHYEDKDFFTARGDARTSIQLARNKHTLKLGRSNRFLIDDPDAPHKLAYLLTKPLKGTLIYNNQGTYSFVLQEVQTTEYDNQELGIADYYKHFPKNDTTDTDDDTEQSSAGKKVWL